MVREGFMEEVRLELILDKNDHTKLSVSKGMEGRNSKVVWATIKKKTQPQLSGAEVTSKAGKVGRTLIMEDFES